MLIVSVGFFSREYIMSRQIPGTKTPARIHEVIQVKSKETFTFFLRGIDPIHFKKGELHPKEFLLSEVKQIIENGRVVPESHRKASGTVPVDHEPKNYTEAGLKGMKLPALKDIARKAGVAFDDKVKKDDLADAILKGFKPVVKQYPEVELKAMSFDALKAIIEGMGYDVDKDDTVETLVEVILEEQKNPNEE